ncbi:MAG: DUF1285 domain-containing protein [Myxococcaceae bacterium]|nr:MAG: DUF1285 domain-containing protein [Myxococcaceae bacterium]
MERSVAEIGIPKRWHTREDSGLVLDRELNWIHDGERITHPKIIEAFNQGLVPTGDGRFQLRLGNDWAYVTVEGAAYRVNAIDTDDSRVYLRLSDRTGEALDTSTLSLGDDGVLTARVKGGRAEARFSRDAQFALGQLLVPEGSGWVLVLPDARIAIPFDPSPRG